ncbi:hypothetical protein PF010_g17199 [Phytophthora fragariae]|uniref:Protein kinase domain-containing protein n=1 Tax=Phytophthora fragariae TaxID=53985 RepID=A0A6G0NHI4_9STRA|nr:hypothetical protein PF010_g17199 [Phytophthora fragariae]KAE9208524.1 hypothetical protein PF004_g16729 [Phytophthora fragariae]
MVESPSSVRVAEYEAYELQSPSSERWHTLSFDAKPLGIAETYRVPPRSDEPKINSTDILSRLWTSPELAGRRLSSRSLRFKATLSSGASGEVWLAVYRGQQVAVKQLLRTNELTLKDAAASTTWSW